VLRRLGRWRVQLTVRSSTGEDVVARSVALRDLLVVSVGDSLSSGEGNPDVNRKVVRDPSTRSGVRVIPADWMDRQCHRSARSWSARVARHLQNRTTTVTFLNYSLLGRRDRQPRFASLPRHRIRRRAAGAARSRPYPARVAVVVRDAAGRCSAGDGRRQ
jgi:hypothetical protein